MRSALVIALLAVAPGLAGAQARLSTTPLTPLLPPPLPGQLVVTAHPVPFSSVAPASDLFVGYSRSFQRFGYRSLERPDPVLGFAPPPSTAVQGVAGLLNENGGDPLADIAYLDTGTLGLDLFFGDAPGTLWQPPSLNFGSGVLSDQLFTAHVLATQRDVLVFTDSDTLMAIDFGGTGAAPNVASSASWTDSGAPAADDTVLALRISPRARAVQAPPAGVDLARNRIIPATFSYAVDLFWLESNATTLDAGVYQLVTVPLSSFEPLGAGALDVNFDGRPDLVVAVVSGTTRKLVWMQNVDDDPTHLAAPQDLTVPGITSPALLRPLDLDGTPAIAVWDAAPPGSIVVVTSEGGQLRTWSAPTGYPFVFDMVAGDVVGGPRADLIVVYSSPPALQVFPDDGDAFPAISWSQGSPPSQSQAGLDLPLHVQATDQPPGSVAKVEWFINDVDPPANPPAVTQTAAPYEINILGPTLCAAASVQVRARAVDDAGLWSDVTAAIPLVPALQVSAAGKTLKVELGASGAGGTLAVPLVPGATSVALSAPCETIVWDHVPPGATLLDSYHLFIPESAYPVMLASGDRSATVTASASSSTATVQVVFDPVGLLQIEHTSDRASLAPGDLALLTTTIRSSLLSTTLSKIRFDDVLTGLEPAGPIQVEGAGASVSADEASVTLDVPPGAVTVIRLAVRGAPAAVGLSSVQAVALPSETPMSPQVSAQLVQAPLPGTGCNSAPGGGGAAWALLLVLLCAPAMRARAGR